MDISNIAGVANTAALANTTSTVAGNAPPAEKAAAVAKLPEDQRNALLDSAPDRAAIFRNLPPEQQSSYQAHVDKGGTVQHYQFDREKTSANAVADAWDKASSTASNSSIPTGSSSPSKIEIR